MILDDDESSSSTSADSVLNLLKWDNKVNVDEEGAEEDVVGLVEISLS